MLTGTFGDWFLDTWTSGEFWRQMAANTIGVFLGAGLAFVVERRKVRHDAELREAEAAAAQKARAAEDAAARSERRATVKRVLADGVLRNVASVRHMVHVLNVQEAIPSLRLTSGHFDTVLLPAAEAFEGDPDAFGRLVNAHQTLEQMNRRLDQVFQIEVQFFPFEFPILMKQEMSAYRVDLVEGLKRLETMLVAVLNDAGAAARLMEIEGQGQRPG